MRVCCTLIGVSFAVVALVAIAANAQSGWDPRQYLEDVRRAGEAADAAEALPDSAGERRLELLQVSLDHRAASLQMLRAALLSGELDGQGEAFLERAQGDLYLGYQNLVWLHLQLEQCALGRATFDEAYENFRLLPAAGTPELDAMNADIGACDATLARSEGERVGLEVEGVVLESAALMEVTIPSPVARTDDTEPSGFRAALPWILTGSGAACLIAGLAIDLANADDLDEFEAIRTACDNGGSCHAERGVTLQSSLQSAKVAEGVLLGVGAAAAITGVVFFFVDPGEDPDGAESLIIEPQVGRQSAGFAISGRF